MSMAASVRQRPRAGRVQVTGRDRPDLHCCGGNSSARAGGPSDVASRQHRARQLARARAERRAARWAEARRRRHRRVVALGIVVAVVALVAVGVFVARWQSGSEDSGAAVTRAPAGVGSGSDARAWTGEAL